MSTREIKPDSSDYRREPQVNLVARDKGVATWLKTDNTVTNHMWRPPPPPLQQVLAGDVLPEGAGGDLWSQHLPCCTRSQGRHTIPNQNLPLLIFILILIHIFILIQILILILICILIYMLILIQLYLYLYL